MPLMFWPGIMGEFMKYLPITLIVTLSSSLFVAMVINPALAAIFMRLKGEKGRLSKQLSADEVSASGENPVEIKGIVLTLYTRFLKKALGHRLVVLFISGALLILLFQVWLLVVGLEKPVEFFPDLDPDSAYVNIDPPEGADLDYIDRIVKKVEMSVNGGIGDSGMPALHLYNSSYKPRLHEKAGGEEFYGPSDLGDIEYIYSKAVETSGGVSFESNLPNHIGIQFLDLEDRKRPSAVCLEEIRKRVKDISGARITVAKQEGGPPTGAPINIEISGDDFRVLGNLAKQVQRIIAKVPFVEDVHDDYVEGIPSVRVRIDRQKAALFGLSTDAIGFALKTAYKGLDISSYHEGDEDFDITVTLDEEDRHVTDVLHKLMLPTPSGQIVPAL